MAEEKALKKIFQWNTGLHNPQADHLVVSNLVPIIKQFMKDNFTDDESNEGDDKFIQQCCLESLHEMQESQSENLISFALLQHALLKECENIIISEHAMKGEKINLSSLQSEKIKLLCQRIMNGDEITQKYIQFFCDFQIEMVGVGPNDYNVYLQFQEDCKHIMVSMYMAMIQHQHHANELMRFSETIINYAFEEGIAGVLLPPGEVIRFDPLYSLPKGLRPSDLLKARMIMWALRPPLHTTNQSNFVPAFCMALTQMLPSFMHYDALLQSRVTIELPNNHQSILIDFIFTDPEKIQFTARITDVIEPTTSDVSIFQLDKKVVQSQAEENVLIKNLLISFDIQCNASMITDDQGQKLRCSNGKLAHSIGDTNCCSSATTHNSKLTKVLANICFECDSLISENCDHHDWKSISFQRINGERVDIKSSLSAYAMSLLTGGSSEPDVDYAEISVKYSKKLLEFNLPQLAVPLLLTVLKHAMCQILKRDAYLLLIDALKKTLLQSDSALLQKWFIQPCYDYISQQASNECQLLDIKTCINKAFAHVLNTNNYLTEVVKVAVEGGAAGSLPYRCLIGQLLSLFKSDQQQHPLNFCTAAAIDILSGIKEMYNKDPLVSLEFFIKATWQNPAFNDVVAKAILPLLPKLTEQKYTFCFQKRNILLPLPIVTLTDLNLISKEKAIQNQVEAGELANSQAALWYLDLMLNVGCSPEKVLCLLKAANHFEQECSRSKILSEKGCFKNAALTCVYDACQLATRLHPGIRLFTFQFALEVTFRLGTSDNTIHSEQSVDALLAAWMFENLVYNRQFTFMWNFPMTLDSVKVFLAHSVNYISYIAQQAYLQNLLKQNECSLPLRCSLLHYQCFENALCGKNESESFLFEERIDMMSKFLKEKGLTPEDVSQRITSPYILRDDNGWLCPQKSLDQDLEIAVLKGFSLSFSDSSPSVQLLFEPAKDGNGLLSFEDVFAVLQLDCNEAFPIRFSLDPPSVTERYHPFLNFRCHPGKLQKTAFMDTLFQADYLLKFLSTGTEVSSIPPFHLRQIKDSLLKNLPENLQHILRPNYVRGYSHMTQHRLWIEAETILFDEETSAEQYNCYIQEVKVVVRSHPLVRGIDDQCHDALHTDHGPHAEFAAEFTANYNEISKYFPVFARLRELAKLQFLMQKIFHLVKSLKETSQTKYEAFTTELTRLRSLGPIKEGYNSECTWVPAVYTIIGKTFMVYGGVTFQSTHKKYYNLYGNHIPNSDDELCWVDVHVKLINPVKCLEPGPGGIYFGIKDHCRVPVYVEDPDSIVCVKLGTTTTTVASVNFASSSSHPPSSITSGEKDPTAHATDEKPPISLPLEPQESNTITQESLTRSDYSDRDPDSPKSLEKNICTSASKPTSPQDQSQNLSEKGENLDLDRPISQANSETFRENDPLSADMSSGGDTQLSQGEVPQKELNTLPSTPSLDLPASFQSNENNCAKKTYPTSSSLDSKDSTSSYPNEDSHNSCSQKGQQTTSGLSEKYQEAASETNLRDIPSSTLAMFNDPVTGAKSKVSSLSPLSHSLEMKTSLIPLVSDIKDHTLDENSGNTVTSANKNTSVIVSRCQLPIHEDEMDDVLAKDASQKDTDVYDATGKKSLFSSDESSTTTLNKVEICPISTQNQSDASETQAISDTISSHGESAAMVSQPSGNHDYTRKSLHSFNQDQSQHSYPNTGDSSENASNLVSQGDVEEDVQTTTEALMDKLSSITAIASSENVPLDNGDSNRSSPAQSSTESSLCSRDAFKASLTNKLPRSNETTATYQVADSDDFDTSHIGTSSHLYANLSAISDSFIASFFKSPLNIAIFGEVMHNAGMNIASESSASEVNMTDFHPDALVREQVKNVVVLRHIIDAYHEQGINFHIKPQ